MRHPMTLSALAAVSLSGAALGIYFGNGAIAEVKPFFFSPEPVTHFYADLVPAGYHPAQLNPVSTADFWTNEASVSGRPQCFDCGNQVDTIYSGSYVPSDPAVQEITIYRDEGNAEPVAPAIERYTSFPVTAEEARGGTAMAEADTAPDIPGAGGYPAEDGPVGM